MTLVGAVFAPPGADMHFGSAFTYQLVKHGFFALH
jgi:hypothetical protein